MQRFYGRNGPLTLIISWMITACIGCSAMHRRSWPAPSLLSPDATIVRKECSVRSGSLALAKAEIAYAVATEAMEQGDAGCVDAFLNAARYAWYDIEQTTGQSVSFDTRAAEIYRSSLNALITEGQKHKRFDARLGLRVRTPSGWSTVPIIHHGFPWSQNDFDELALVGEYSTTQLNHTYRSRGIGVPVVAIRHRETDEPFHRDRQAFAATFLLRQTTSGDSMQDPLTVLELYDPLRTSSLVSQGSNLPLARDSTAPIARALSTLKRSYVQSFLQPGLVKPDDEGLFMLEPYQPGKIPIIFIHGLLSDRLTWANIVNEIIARPEFVERYQLWGFEYPTGEPFLTSATLLRRQLEEIRERIDPQRIDHALNRIVLVGHSMGGLIAKMQITESGLDLWNAFSFRHFEELSMSPETRGKLAEAAFFRPSPMVSRVIFIGTPHRGSALAQQAIGRIGSLLIEEPTELKSEHARLVDDNPGAFSDEFTRRIPTSIDLLAPTSPLLQAIDSLPIHSDVRLHSIIGHGRWMPGNGDSDGVVPVSSARLIESNSECMVGGKHAKLTEDPAAIQEVLAILRQHHSEAIQTIDGTSASRVGIPE